MDFEEEIIEGLVTHLPAELVGAGMIAATAAIVKRWRGRRVESKQTKTQEDSAGVTPRPRDGHKTDVA